MVFAEVPHVFTPDVKQDRQEIKDDRQAIRQDLEKIKKDREELREQRQKLYEDMKAGNKEAVKQDRARSSRL